MKNINYKAIIISNLSDIILTPIIGAVFTLFVVVIKGLYKYPTDVLSKILVQMVNDGPLRYILFVSGAIVSIFVGVLSAKIAGKEYIKYGALSAVLCVTHNLYIAFTRSPQPLYISLPIIMLSPILGALGGYLYGKYYHK